jgi:phosphoglycolate phosphatase
MIDLTNNRTAFQNLKKPKAIIFDWDNTLVDTWPLIQYSIDATMRKMGKEEWGLEKVKNSVHKSMRESFPEIFGQNWQEAGEFYKNSYRAINLKELKFLDGALELIKTINELGILQFVVSNKIGATLRKEVENLDVKDLFFACIGAGDAIADKPSKDPVELAILGSDLKLGEDEIWFIGDTVADVCCAYNSNCTPIIFSEEEGKVSPTIPKDILQQGLNGKAPPALYFKHQELIDFLQRNRY